MFHAPPRLRIDFISRVKHRQLSKIDKNLSCVRAFWLKFTRFLAQQQQILLLIFVTRILNSCKKREKDKKRKMSKKGDREEAGELTEC